MYDLPQYKDQDQLRAFMEAHPFATICVAGDDGFPVATQLPLLIRFENGRYTFRGHMMRGTDHYKAFEKNPRILCIFSYPGDYISATWYNNQQQGSTWNYMTVQAAGTLKFLDTERLKQILQDTTLHFEKNDGSSPTVFNNLPETYAAPLLKAIAGFEIVVQELRHVFKLSQDRPAEEIHRIAEKLIDDDTNSVTAREMLKRCPHDVTAAEG